MAILKYNHFVFSDWETMQQQGLEYQTYGLLGWIGPGEPGHLTCKLLLWLWLWWGILLWWQESTWVTERWWNFTALWEEAWHHGQSCGSGYCGGASCVAGQCLDKSWLPEPQWHCQQTSCSYHGCKASHAGCNTQDIFFLIEILAGHGWALIVIWGRPQCLYLCRMAGKVPTIDLDFTCTLTGGSQSDHHKAFLLLVLLPCDGDLAVATGLFPLLTWYIFFLQMCKFGKLGATCTHFLLFVCVNFVKERAQV